MVDVASWLLVMLFIIWIALASNSEAWLVVVIHGWTKWRNQITQKLVFGLVSWGIIREFI